MSEFDGALFNASLRVEIKALVLNKIKETYALEVRDKFAKYKLHSADAQPLS